MYLIKEKIAPEFQSQNFELNIEAISLRSKKFEINTNMYKIGVVIDGSIELMYRDKVKELKKVSWTQKHGQLNKLFKGM